MLRAVTLSPEFVELLRRILDDRLTGQQFDYNAETHLIALL